MICNYRGCDCWYCYKNNQKFICKYYKELCAKNVSTKRKCVDVCNHMAVNDGRNIIFKKIEQLKRFVLIKYLDIKIWLYLFFGTIKDIKQLFKEAIN